MQQVARREVSASDVSAAPLVAHGPARSWLRAALQPKLLPNHYPPLHGLRVMAIILVVQLHATSALWKVGVLPFSTDPLWFGMDLFFFLSGFLIGSMLLVESRSGQRVDMMRFYLRRSFRIVPAYLIVLTALALLLDHPPERRANLWFEYLYLTNYVPPTPDLVVMPWAWSLAVEEHFYLVVPVLVIALRKIHSQRAQLLVLGLLWLSALAVRGWTFAVTGPWHIDAMMNVFYVQSHLRYDILVAGIFTACVQHYHGAVLVERLQRGPLRHILAGVSLVFFAVLLFTQGIFATVPAYALLCWGTFTSLAYVPLVLLVLNRESGLSRMLSRHSFVRIATFGYGIYLIHLPVIWLLVLPLGADITTWAHLSPPVIWLLVLCATFVVSTLGGYLIHVLIEKPALLLRDRFSP
jgi:peptidoglycan/LPS O-acetylase OafA/YrhL